MPVLKTTQTLIQIIVLLCLVSTTVKAQSLNYIPPNEPNTRFGSEDVFKQKIARPALSIRGFDSSILQEGNNHGLGVKQILENYLSEDERFVDVIQIIISQANQSLKTPTGSLDDKRLDLDFNSRVTQSRAFVALAACLITNN